MSKKKEKKSNTPQGVQPVRAMSADFVMTPKGEIVERRFKDIPDGWRPYLYFDRDGSLKIDY
jgi:hypothetical protein